MLNHDRIDWTARSDGLLGALLEDGTPIAREHLVSAMRSIKWHYRGKGLKAPAMVGMAVESIIKDLGYHYSGVVRIGWTNELAPFSLIGITYRYKDQDADSFWFDRVDTVTGVAGYRHGKRITESIHVSELPRV